LAAGAGHVAGGTTANLFAGQSLDKAFATSFKGIGKSMTMGGAIGIGTTIGISYAGGRSPWTGEVLASKGGTHLVYEGLDAAGKVRYVGITERDAAIRFGEHLNSGTARSLLDYNVIKGAEGLSKTQARIWEQTLINQYGLQKNGGLLLNKINSIAPKYWWQYDIK
jgi:hypothetical protein